MVLGSMRRLGPYACLVLLFMGCGPRCVPPKLQNELCQVAKIDEALAPVSAALPITSRYLKSTTLVVRNRAQIEKLIGTMPVAALSASEQARLQQALDQTNSMISMLSDPASVDAATLTALGDIEQDILVLADRLAKGPQGMRPTADALAQPNWGTSEVEIPLLPMTPRVRCSMRSVLRLCLSQSGS